MNEEHKNCAFQYYDGRKVVVDIFEISITEAKELFNCHLPDMVSRAKNGAEIEVALWVNMADNADYSDSLIHLSSPQVDKFGNLWEKKIYGKL